VLHSSEIPANNELSALRARNEELENVNAQQQQQIDYLKFELLQLKKLFSGSRSERFQTTESVQQLPLGFNLEPIAEAVISKSEIKEHTRTSVELKAKNHKGRNAFPSYLKRETTVLEPENRPEDAKQIGVDATETLEYSEATLFVKRTERPKYVVKGTEGVLMYPMPERALGRSMFGNSFAAQAIVSKFVDHQPEYRQMQALKRQDIHVPSSSFNDIFSSVANALVGVYEACGNEVFSGSYLQADETPNRVLTNEKKGKCHQGYYWAYRSPEKNMVFFDYREGRSGEGPRDKLKNFKGRLQSDGFSVYDQFGKKIGITLFHCWAHARRPFKQALDSDKRAQEMMELIQKLYEIERVARDQKYSFDQRLLLRQERSLPILEEMRQWLNRMSNQVLEKDPLAKAIAYSVKRWEGLTYFAKDGSVEIDNNWVENSIRPLTLGRKNYMFAGSHEGAKRAAMYYTFFGTCKLKNINPYKWLKETLDKLPHTSSENLADLLP
jgi:transposase